MICSVTGSPLCALSTLELYYGIHVAHSMLCCVLVIHVSTAIAYLLLQVLLLSLSRAGDNCEFDVLLGSRKVVGGTFVCLFILNIESKQSNSLEDHLRSDKNSPIEIHGQNQYLLKQQQPDTALLRNEK